MLERQFGEHPEIAARRSKLTEAAETAVPAVFEFGGGEEFGAAADSAASVSLEAEMAFASLAPESIFA
jgi:hypothetical protein